MELEPEAYGRLYPCMMEPLLKGIWELALPHSPLTHDEYASFFESFSFSCSEVEKSVDTVVEIAPGKPRQDTQPV
jgi:hypothetical protein